MKKAKYFFLGARDLLVVVDHHLLLGLYRPDRDLSKVKNPRLSNLVEKTSRFRFKTIHLAGAQNSAADVFSRSPVGKAEHFEISQM